MFSNVKLTVGSQLVENVNLVGHISSMIYDVIYARSKAENDGLQFMWTPDTDATASNDNKGFGIREIYIINHSTYKWNIQVAHSALYVFWFYGKFCMFKRISRRD